MLVEAKRINPQRPDRPEMPKHNLPISFYCVHFTLQTGLLKIECLDSKIPGLIKFYWVWIFSSIYFIFGLVRVSNDPILQESKPEKYFIIILNYRFSNLYILNICIFFKIYYAFSIIIRTIVMRCIIIVYYNVNIFNIFIIFWGCFATDLSMNLGFRLGLFEFVSCKTLTESKCWHHLECSLPSNFMFNQA